MLSKSEEGQKLSLFLIANSLYPYGYDATRVLSLPPGSFYRARFDESFVSEQIKRDFRSITGQQGYYVFRDFATGVLIPLISIEIDKISRIGSIYFIEYRIGQILDFPQNPATLRQQIANFNQQFTSQHANEVSDHKPGGHLRPLVLTTRLTPSFQSEVETLASDEFDKDTRRWSAIAKLLGCYDYFEYVPFIRIVGIRKVGSSDIIPLTNTTVLVSDTEYRLQLAHTLEYNAKAHHGVEESQTDRTIDFQQRASFQLHLQGDPRVVEIQRPTIYVTGPYDVNYIDFRTKDYIKNKNTVLTLDFLTKPTGILNLETGIALNFLLTSRVNFPVRRLLLLLGLLFVYFIPNIYPIIFQYLHFNERIVQDLTIVAVSLTSFDLITEIRKFMEN